MEIRSFTNPSVLVQTISIYSYLNTLGDFLHTENILAGNDKHKPIATINSLCRYLEEDKDGQGRTLNLTRELLRRSDLYGGKENEVPDVHFVNTLFDHIISYPVFEKYVSIYGFLAESVRVTKHSSLGVLSYSTITYLQSEFENEYGPDSRLDPCSFNRIFDNLIAPLFPITDGYPSLISVDYIYAQAGLMFFRSSHLNSTYKLDENNFDEYLALGLTIEQLFIAGELDESVLRIFALPALFHYVYHKEETLRDEKIEDIMTDPKHWSKAYHLLFSSLSRTFEELDSATNRKSNKLLINSDERHFLSFGRNISQIAIFRRTIRSMLNIGKKTIMKAVNFSKLTRKYKLNDFGTDMSRILNPGFNLVVDIEEAGLKSIQTFVSRIIEEFKVPFDSTEQMLNTSMKVLKNSPRKIGEKFGTNVYINSLSTDNVTGCGYKFIYLPNGKIAELRNVYEFDTEVPVVLKRVTSESAKIYNLVVPETGKILENDLHIRSSQIIQEKTSLQYLYDHESIEETSECHPFRRRRSPVARPSSCIMFSAFDKRMRNENRALDLALSAKGGNLQRNVEKISVLEIRNELRKYLFPENGNKELDFIKDWLSDENMRVPEWSTQYRMKEPEIFFTLKYQDVHEDFRSLTVQKMKQRLSALYSQKQLRQMEKYYSLSDLLVTYRQKNVMWYQNFEDFYALARYEWTPLSNAMKDVDGARRIKMAIYKLSIRQSDDPIDKFSRIAYRMDLISRKKLGQLYEGAEYRINKFTAVSSKVQDATLSNLQRFAGPNVQVVYEIRFNKPYLRANLEKIGVSALVDTILLPGTKFRIDEIIKNGHEIQDLFIGPYDRIVLSCKPFGKLKWQQDVMAEIEKLKNSGTKFYQDSSILGEKKDFFSKIKSFFSKERD